MVLLAACNSKFQCFHFLRDSINAIFWPAILDGDVSASELSLFTLPARLGGMGINDPVDSAGIAFSTSRTCTKQIVDAIKGHGEFSVFDHNNQMHDAKKQQKIALLDISSSYLVQVFVALLLLYALCMTGHLCQQLECQTMPQSSAELTGAQVAQKRQAHRR